MRPRARGRGVRSPLRPERSFPGWFYRSRPAIIRTEEESCHPEVALLEDVGNTRDNNPYTIMEGYELQDASGARVGKIQETVYDAVSDVLKYVIANGHSIPADRIEVD